MAKKKEFNPQDFESKWSEKWEESGIYRADDDSEKPKSYVLIEFPYPSGERLHVGHARSYSCMDSVARLRRMKGMNVLYPFGWDAFGLPAENYAIKTGVHPTVTTKQNIANARKQAISWGLSFDWSREVNTTDPSYYKWTQWIFVQLFKKGLAYKEEVAVNWCPSCKINLADEEVINGTCERCGAKVERRTQSQWMLKITEYADRLLEDLDTVNYREDIRMQQENWIGRKEGAKVKFEIPGLGLNKKNFIILHAHKSGPEADFYSWLKDELESAGATVQVPQLPGGENPKIDEQVTYLLENFSFDENTVLVTHSLGGVLALKLLPRLDKKINKLALVAMPLKPEFLDGKDRPELKVATDWKFDFQGVREKVHEIVVLQDDNDPIVPAEHGQRIATTLEARFVELEAQEGHFGASHEPAVLEQIKQMFEAFTTRIDTLYGVTFLVVAPEVAAEWLEDGWKASKEVMLYVDRAVNKSEEERKKNEGEKTGVDTGLFALHPATGEKLPVYVAEYVLRGVGTGVVMGVPAHDARDWEFAKKHNLKIKTVVEGGEDGEVYIGEGVLTASGEYSDMKSGEAREKMVEDGLGEKMVHYHLRDWVFSRQHYWGEPIPMIYCEKCGWQSVPEDDLPVTLPEVEKYEPTDTGESPLATMEEWVNTKCPKCDGEARRETDTMPNWAGSSWYFVRYVDPHNDKAVASRERLSYWMPVDWYNGGMEHTTLHLLYSRFWYKFLYDIGVVPGAEPYAKRTSHGVILGPDGRKMSKSKGNVINPDEVVAKYGADTLRMYEMFVGPFSQMVAWSWESVEGVHRFLKRVWALYSEELPEASSEEARRMMTQLIKKVEDDIEEMKYNTAVAACMEFVNFWSTHKKEVGIDVASDFLKVLAPMAPFITEELWSRGQDGSDTSIHTQEWPKVDESMLQEREATVIVQINGKMRGAIHVASDKINEKAYVEELAEKEVERYILNGDVLKKIHVPGKVLNFVIKDAK